MDSFRYISKYISFIANYTTKWGKKKVMLKKKKK